MALLLTQWMYIFSVFLSFLPTKVEQWPCCAAEPLCICVRWRSIFEFWTVWFWSSFYKKKVSVLTTFLPIVGGTPLWDPRYAFFHCFCLHGFREVYIYSFPFIFTDKSWTMACCWRGKCIYLAFSIIFCRGKLNNGLVADAANVYI